MAVDNATGAQGCNHYPNCNWAGHSSNYHLTPAQLETPVVTSMDYDLSMPPLSPGFLTILPATTLP